MVGVGMGVIGSIGINVGQNLQAAGIQALSLEERTQPHKSKTWIIGTATFVLFSLINFAALALAPASVLTPLESIQFVTNVVYNRVINKAVVSMRMLVGVACACAGTVLSVVFGAQPAGCHSLPQLHGFWASAVWWVYLAISLSIAVAAFVTLQIYTRRMNKELPPLPGGVLVRPLAFTFSSALAGGAQMIVHSKVLSELLAMLFQGQVAPLKSWLLYVELVLVITCGIIWVVKLTECLGLFDPLLILPLMVGTYILFGGVAGGIFFGEFANLHLTGSWPLYIMGMLLVLCGLGIIADASVRLEEANALKFALRALREDPESPAPIGPIGTPGALAADDATPAKPPRPPPLQDIGSFDGSGNLRASFGSPGDTRLRRLRQQSVVYVDRASLVYQMPSPMLMQRTATIEKKRLQSLSQSWQDMGLTPNGRPLPRQIASDRSPPSKTASDPTQSSSIARRHTYDESAGGFTSLGFGLRLFGAGGDDKVAPPPATAASKQQTTSPSQTKPEKQKSWFL